MSSTIPELQLSPVYRHAQRTFGGWLEPRAGGRQHAFRARLAFAALDPGDRHRLARWLAWLCAAARHRDGDDMAARLRRLDGALHQLVAEALQRLPAIMPILPAARRHPHRWVSADTASGMTSVRLAR